MRQWCAPGAVCSAGRLFGDRTFARRAASADQPATIGTVVGAGIALVRAMAIDLAIKHDWEAAEIARSGVEARLTEEARLVADEANVARYLNPPRDTAFPLEYAYALLGDAR